MTRPKARLTGALAAALGAPLRRVDDAQITRAEAIVVLGAPLAADGSLPLLARERVALAADLYHLGVAPVVALTGGHVPKEALKRGDSVAIQAERAGAFHHLVALGVPPHAVRVERVSATTRQNADQARLLLGPRVRDIWIVTQPFHTRRALICFKRAGFRPRAYADPRGVEAANPDLALRWITREHAALAWLLTRTALSAVLSQRLRAGS
jgi:uncharacterized SAM-binding protein YcdF (DUF218 family)